MCIRDSYGIDPQRFENEDLHIHVPEGATPKDGPSAGIAMVTAIVSAYTQRPVRCDVAMTGEVNLRGEVLPIGGLKEKLLAARRGGIKTVLIPEENRRDLKEVPENIKGALDIRPVRWIDDVLAVALAENVTEGATLKGADKSFSTNAVASTH
jgi:ATP-dependent Lon protease